MAYMKVSAGSFGFLPNSPSNGYASQSINAAATWVAFSFIAAHASLNEITVANTLTGTLAAADITCSIYTDGAGGVPGTNLETQNCAATPVGGFNTWTGFTTSLTVGDRYWAVFKNLNGTPASNFLGMRYPAAGAFPITAGSNVIQGWAKRHSTDSGSTWAAGNVAGSAAVFLAYDTAGTPVYDGFSGYSTAISTTERVYGGREYGVIFTTPSTGNFNVTGANFFLYRNGTPTVDAVYKLYEGTTLVATSENNPINNTASGAVYWTSLAFSSTITLTNNTSYRLVIAEPSNSDTSSNYYATYRYLLSTVTGVQNVLPFNGSLQQTYYNGSSWTEDSGYICPFGLILDVDAEIESSGGGGGTTFIYNLME